MKYKINKEKFKKAILNSGLTVVKLAEKAKVSRQTIYRILREDSAFSGYIISRLSKGLDVDIEELIEE